MVDGVKNGRQNRSDGNCAVGGKKSKPEKGKREIFPEEIEPALMDRADGGRGREKSNLKNIGSVPQ